MAVDIIQLPPDGSGKKIASRSYTEGANTVYAQAGYITTDAASGNPVFVGNTVPATTDYSLFTRTLLTDPESGVSGSHTNSRDQLVAQRYILQQDSLANGIDTAAWTSTVANGGTNTVSGGEALLQTSANATGAATLSYVVAVPYQPGQQHFFTASIRLGDTGLAANIRRWGPFTVSGVTPQEGFAFELNDTTLNAVSYKAGAVTRVASGSWSRNAIAPFTLDTNYHIYEIRYSGTAAYFYIDNVLRHVMTTTTTPLTGTLDFPMGVSNINTTTATNRILAVRNINIGRFGANSAILGTQPPVISASWTSGTTVNTALTLPVQGMNTVSVAMHNTATMTGGVLTFEVSPDNTNWFPIALARIDSYTVETTYTLNAVADRAWSTSVDGFNYFRVRLSTVITGTGTASVFAAAQTFAIEPIVSVGQASAANLNATVTATNLSSNISQINAVTPLMGNGVTGTGSQRVTIASDNTAFTVNAAQSGTWTVQPGNTANSTAWLTSPRPATAGGLTMSEVVSAATTNATSVKGSAGQLYGWYITNTNAAIRYVKFYNKATAPTVGTDTVVLSLGIPGGGAANVFTDMGIAFSTGIAMSMVTGSANTDATAVALGDLVVNLFYA